MKNMVLTESQICMLYRDAKRPQEEIKILSQLNGCSKDKIKEILVKHGYDTTLIEHRSHKKLKLEPSYPNPRHNH